MAEPQITHVVGARPNFMKAAPVVHSLEELGAGNRIIHTGQHYDDMLSTTFFQELDIPEPDVNLEVGSGSHSHQTALILQGLEEQLCSTTNAVVVYGDVNSTLAAAIHCAKAQIPLVHVEAGLRSYDRSMPEEVNRVLTDAVADLLLITSPEAYANLAREGVATSRIRFIGNPMIDTLVRNRHRFDPSTLIQSLELPDRYGVVTLHRPSNVDDVAAARHVLAALTEVSAGLDLVFPVHPRGRRRLSDLGLSDVAGIRVIDPLGYIDFLSLVSGSQLVITDSGGVQEETTVLQVPCLTLRRNTERPITITHGTNQLVEAGALATTAARVLDPAGQQAKPAPPLWDGAAGPRAATAILEFVSTG